MEEGVSPSLPRNGFSFSSELGFSSSLSVSVSVSVYCGSNFPDASHHTSFYLANPVSSTRKPVVSVPSSGEHGFSGDFILPESQVVEGDSLRVSLVGSAYHISVEPISKARFCSDGSNLLDWDGRPSLKGLSTSVPKKGVANGGSGPSVAHGSKIGNEADDSIFVTAANADFGITDANVASNAYSDALSPDRTENGVRFRSVSGSVIMVLGKYGEVTKAVMPSGVEWVPKGVIHGPISDVAMGFVRSFPKF